MDDNLINIINSIYLFYGCWFYFGNFSVKYFLGLFFVFMVVYKYWVCYVIFVYV